MKQKLFTLLTLLCFAVSGAWADDPTLPANGTPAGSLNVLNGDAKVTAAFSGTNNGKKYLTYDLGTEIRTNVVKNGKANWAAASATDGGSSVSSITFADGVTDADKYGFKTTSLNKWGINSGRYCGFRVVNCIEAAVSTKSNSTKDNKTLQIQVYKKNGDAWDYVETVGADIYNNSKAYVLKTSALDANEEYIILLTSGSASNSDAYEIRFAANATPILTGAWKIAEETVTEANVVQGSAAPTVPTFTVGATSGTPTTDNYTVAYSLKDGSTAGIITFTDGVPTAISTSTAGTATIVATLTTKDASAFLTPATNTFEYSVTVSAATAPTIDITGSSSAIRGADAITLTADVTGTPSPTIEWFQCDDALKTNPVSQGAASTANTTFDFSTTTVGTYYFYAVANNGVGGDGDHNVFSDVKTITIVPKAPSITAGGKFVTSKTVTITKADGEAGAATIKYSTNGGSTWNDYSEPFSVNATTTVDAKVVQSGLESAEVSATYTLFVPSELTSISTATTWDFSNISANSSHAYYANSGIQLTSTTFPTKTSTDFYVYGDFVDDFYTVKAGKTFNGAALAFSATEYPIRNTYAMGTSLKFKTTVPGVIKVKFNNTGTSARPYRYLKVNDDVTEYKSANATAVTTNGIYVPAGEVVVSGYIVNASDPSSKDGDVVGPAMLQISQLFFEPLDDADAVSVTSAGYATFVLTKDAYFDATPEVTAYAAKAADTKITLTEVKAAPAGTPILLKADEGNYTLKKASSIAPAAVSANDLEAGPVTDSDGTNYYVLGKEGSKVGFGLLADGVNLPATKAYIAASKFAEARSFFAFDEDGETTGITNINSKREFNGEFYNLAGQKVANPTKGLYIVNGKKVIIK